MLNTFALRSFRNVADADYIAARMAFKAQLYPQALWASQQVIEKYLKSLLLFRRITQTKGTHHLGDLLKKVEQAFSVKLYDETRKFIKRIDEWDVDRYFLYSYSAERSLIALLDCAVWDIRRYCIAYHEDPASMKGKASDAQDLSRIEDAPNRDPQKFRSPLDGYLEEVLRQMKSQAKDALLWNNFYFGKRIRRINRNFNDSFYSANSFIALYPQMLPELENYIFLPPELRSKKPKQ